MSNIDGATQPNEDLKPSTEQAQVQTIEEERQAPAPDLEEPSSPPQEEKAEEKPGDPRADRLERIADTRRQKSNDELQAIAEAVVDPSAPPEPEPEPKTEPEPERKHRLKIRGQEVEMTDAEVIALAQKNGAADDYLAESRRIRDEIDVLRREFRKAPEGETEEQRLVREQKVDRIAKAIDMIQSGGDPAEAQAILKEEVAEQARTAARDMIETDRIEVRAQTYDRDFEQGYSEARETDGHSDLIDNPITFNMVTSLSTEMQRRLMADAVGGLDQNTRAAFAQAGITPENLASYAPHEVTALYKDMSLKGYQLPQPSAIIRSAAKTIAENLPGTTPPRTAPTPEPQPQPALDRSARKEAIVSPERTSIPRPQPGREPPPSTPPQRAAQARAEMRATRRTGAPARA